MTKRVVVTGMAGISPIGNDWPTVCTNLKAQQSGIVTLPEWDQYEGLKTRLAGKVSGFKMPSHYSRKKVRSMGPMSLYATRATELALMDAQLLESPWVRDGTLGMAYGSTSGSPESMVKYSRIPVERTLKGLNITQYIQMMSNSLVVNLGQFFGIQGRVMSSCSACTSGSQAIGFAYESIKYGQQALMIAGGAEELHVIESAVFDILFATSTMNDHPEKTPRPFDQDRDGLVVGEGAGTLVLEELEHALARQAPIYAEVVGFGTNCDGSHITQPNAAGMQRVMALALKDAQLDPHQIGYVNAHGTATDLGDVAETQATHAVYERQIPISSLKSYTGHTLGACGVLEAWMSIQMMREGWFSPTLNLDNVDPRCGDLDFIQGEGREIGVDYIMSNNFAFGGINTSLIFRRWQN